jgi:hypothetical protein
MRGIIAPEALLKDLNAVIATRWVTSLIGVI